MSDLIENLKAKLLHSTELIQQIASERNRRTGRSPNTEQDYLRLSHTLLMRAKTTDGGLIGAVLAAAVRPGPAGSPESTSASVAALPSWKYGACCHSPRSGVVRYNFCVVRAA